MKSKRPLFLITGIILLLFFILMAIAPGMFTDYGEKEMFKAWLSPSPEHILGTNLLGYDVFTELCYGAGDTLFIGLISSLLTIVLGTAIGILAAEKGPVGSIFNGLINIFVLLPKLITLIVLASFLGNSRRNLIALISAFSWVGIARNVRSKVMSLNARTFTQNLIIQGFSRRHIAVRHILPNLSDVLLSRFLLGVNSCIMMESTLSFLGFGDLYHPTWGTMINFAYKRGAFIRQAFAYLLSPGICIMLVSLSFYFISLYVEGQKDLISEA